MAIPPVKKVEIRTTSGKEYTGYLSEADYLAILAALNSTSGSVQVTINSAIRFRSSSIESVELI